MDTVCDLGVIFSTCCSWTPRWLELELLWASTSGTQTELASGVLLDLDTVAGLLPLHTMRQTWSYAWV